MKSSSSGTRWWNDGVFSAVPRPNGAQDGRSAGGERPRPVAGSRRVSVDALSRNFSAAARKAEADVVSQNWPVRHWLDYRFLGSKSSSNVQKRNPLQTEPRGFAEELRRPPTVPANAKPNGRSAHKKRGAEAPLTNRKIWRLRLMPLLPHLRPRAGRDRQRRAHPDPGRRIR